MVRVDAGHTHVGHRGPPLATRCDDAPPPGNQGRRCGSACEGAMRRGRRGRGQGGARRRRSPNDPPPTPALLREFFPRITEGEFCLIIGCPGNPHRRISGSPVQSWPEERETEDDEARPEGGAAPGAGPVPSGGLALRREGGLAAARPGGRPPNHARVAERRCVCKCHRREE